MKNILAVEDDRGLREGIELALRREDFRFKPCSRQYGQEQKKGGSNYFLIFKPDFIKRHLLSGKRLQL